MGTAGSSPGYLCMNAGNQLRVGWNSPIITLTPPFAEFNVVGRMLDGTPTEGGRWELPAAASTDTNHLFLNFNSLGGVPFPNTFISFRARSPTFDNILSSDMNNRVGCRYQPKLHRTLMQKSVGLGMEKRAPVICVNACGSMPDMGTPPIWALLAGPAARVRHVPAALLCGPREPPPFTESCRS